MRGVFEIQVSKKKSILTQKKGKYSEEWQKPPLLRSWQKKIFKHNIIVF